MCQKKPGSRCAKQLDANFKKATRRYVSARQLHLAGEISEEDLNTARFAEYCAANLASTPNGDQEFAKQRKMAHEAALEEFERRDGAAEALDMRISDAAFDQRMKMYADMYDDFLNYESLSVTPRNIPVEIRQEAQFRMIRAHARLASIQADIDAAIEQRRKNDDYIERYPERAFVRRERLSTPI